MVRIAVRVVGVAAAVAAVVAGVGQAAARPVRVSAPPSEQTHPSVRPATGGPGTKFVLRLTVRDALGVHGVVQTDYRVSASGRGRGCSVGFARSPLLSGQPGQRVSIPMGTFPCVARYRGVVVMDRGPYCPRPAAGQPPRPCPEFASQSLVVGRFSFRVR